MPLLVFTRRKYLVSVWEVADSYIDSPPPSLLTVSRRAASLAIPIETYRWMLSQKEPIPTVFREHRESQNFQIYRPIYGAVLEQPSLPRKSSDHVMSLLVFSSRALALAAACRGVIDLKYGL